jgi:peroxiredoxin
MMDEERRPPVRVGEPAPAFTLPLVNGEGTVSLSDYRGKSTVLLAIFRGLHCAFCRRHIAQLGRIRENLRVAAMEPLAITASPLERARMYLGFRPMKLPMAADPELLTHRLYGLPRNPPTPELQEWLRSRYREFARELGAAMSETASYPEIKGTVNRLDHFEMTDEDWAAARRGEGLIGQFLVDPAGIVRWTNIEGPTEATGLGAFPSAEQLVAIARQV